MQIGIVGGGGIGSYYAGLLSQAGHPVRLLTRGEHLLAIQKRGLEVRTIDDRFIVTPEATSDDDRLVGCDYVLVAVKSYSLPDVAPGLVKAARSGAAIVPLLNGIDVAERLVRLGVPREAIIGGFVRASLVRTEPGVVERKSTFDTVVVGELDRVTRERTSKLVEVLSQTRATIQVSDDILHDSWKKFAFIVPMGVVCGLSRSAMDRVLATERGRQLVADTVRELVSVSRGALTSEDAQTVRDQLFAIQGPIKPSFLLDLERGGPTELDLLAGTVSRLGKEQGVPTPIHDVATAAFEIAVK